MAAIFLFSDTLTVHDFFLQWQDEESNAGYLVQPVEQAEVHEAGGIWSQRMKKMINSEGEEEVDDDDMELQVLTSSSHLKKKRDEDEDGDGEDGVVEYTTKSSKKKH
ncbi:hypothetical protein D5086_031212 [Populus alba]|uniref:Uncharacterized protein n=2 Tax=Populus alba TaxID=43335 RepID=A0A4U5R0T0_POPAL|nr:hypothetical protein D5086_0000032720 [Populus alba]